MTPSPRSNFESKFLSKLSKIDRQEIENFLSHIVHEKNFLEIVFDAMVDGIVVLRPSLEVIYTNAAAIDMLGVSPRRKIIGERITELCPNDHFCELVARFAIKREHVSNYELELSYATQRILTISIIPLQADYGKADGSVVMILHDVTESRRREAEQQKLERAKAYSTLAAGLAHEIKNPLNSLMIHAQLLKRALRSGRLKKDDKDRVLQSSDIILEEIERLSSVVTDFLSAVRPTRPMSETGRINGLVEHVIATLRPEADQRRVDLRMSLDHDIPATEFDPNQMTQAIINLVKNSFDAVEGMQDARVEVRTEMLENSYAVHIKDNGRGISEEDKMKIFQPYFTTKFSGTGLGLAIVTRIVEEHGGQIEVLSHKGGGTAVTMLFPILTRPVRLLNQEEKPTLLLTD